MKKKYFTISLGLLLLLGVVLSVVLFTTKAKEEKINNFNDELVFNSENNDGIKLNMRRSNSSTSSNTYTITATVEPSDVVNKKLKWQLNWTSSVSLKISSYVTMEVAEDTLSATITYIKNFDTQIILTVNSQASTSVKATCTLDCYKRVSNVELNFVDGTATARIDEKNKQITYSFDKGGIGANTLGTMEIYDYSLTGSHEGDEFEVIEYLEFSSDFCDILENLEIDFNNGALDISNHKIKDAMNDDIAISSATVYNLIRLFIADDDQMDTVMANLDTIFACDHIFTYSFHIVNKTAKNAGVKNYSYFNYYELIGFSYFYTHYYTVKSISLNTSAIIF